MKRFFSIILSVLFFIALGFTLLFNVLRLNLNSDAILDLGKEVLLPEVNFSQVQKNNSGVFYPENKILKNAEYDYSQMDLSSIDLSQIAQSYADEYGLDIQFDNEMIKEVIDSPKVNNLLENYVDEIISYVSGKSENLNIDSAELEAAMEDAIEICEKKSGKKIDYKPEELKDAIDEGIKEAVPEVQKSLDDVKKNNQEVISAIEKLLNVFSVKNLLLLILVLVVIAAGLFGINREVLMTLKYISITAVSDGVLLLIAGLFSGVITALIVSFLPSDAVTAGITVGKIVHRICKGFIVSGIVTIVLGTVLCFVGFGKFNREK